MSLLVVGLSHHRAPFALLERVALTSDSRARLTHTLLAGEHVREAVVLSTCNRTEVYAEVETFHGGLAEATQALAGLTGVAAELLSEFAHVHHADRAVAHAFSVAAGLDSMAVGETQILGQLRAALSAAQDADAVGPELNPLLQQALRVGKRVHTETALDTVAVSLVEAGLARATEIVGDLSRARIVLVGAGAMAGLAGAHARRLLPASLAVLNRSAEPAERLAERVAGVARPLGELRAAIAEADVVISCTGAAGTVIGADDVAPRPADRPLVLLDLAVPHDVDRAAADLPGVTRIDLEDLRDRLRAATGLPQVAAADDLVLAEVAAYVAARAADRAAPTVAALRARAQEVVTAELARFRHKVDVDERTGLEVDRLVNRVVDKLLHAPTVRVKELTTSGDGDLYAEVLRELFALDPHETATVSAPPRGPGVPS